MYSIILKPQVYNMLDEAYQWYELQSNGLGERLLSEIEIKLLHLAQNPLLHSFSNDGFRHALLRHFPYKIAYEIIEQDVIVYAIFHSSRGDIKMR